MMNMGMQSNPMLMQKLLQLRSQGGNSQPVMQQGGGNPNVSAMPQMGSMPMQNPNMPMQGGGMQSMAPQDPMMARKLMMMNQQMRAGGGNGGGMPSMMGQ